MGGEMRRYYTQLGWRVGRQAETLYPRCKAGKRADETMQCDVVMGVGGETKEAT